MFEAFDRIKENWRYSGLNAVQRRGAFTVPWFIANVALLFPMASFLSATSFSWLNWPLILLSFGLFVRYFYRIED